MRIHRPEDLEEFIGHLGIVKLLRTRVENNNMPHFFILTGEEGIGKTSLADIIAGGLDAGDFNFGNPIYKEVVEKVMRQNKDTQDVRKFIMSENGGMDNVKPILAELNANYIKGKAKVIIMEDVHAMDKKAQESFLSAFEYIPKDVYVIATSNGLSTLLPKFKSRAVIFTLHRLTLKEMREVLSTEARRRNLVFPSETAFDIIAKWAEFKPRKALKALEALGDNTRVTMDDIKGYIDYIDPKVFMPLVKSFAGSPLIGMKTCMSLPTDGDTLNYLIDFLIASIQMAYGQMTTTISLKDRIALRDAIEDIDVSVLENFLLEVSRLPTLEHRRLLAAYLKCHPARKRISDPDDSVLQKELADKSKHYVTENVSTVKLEAPTLDDLLRNSSKLEE